MADSHKSTDRKTGTDRPDSTSSPEPVGTAAKVEGGSTSMPLSGQAPLASESSDPAVHQLLAERDALRMTREQVDPPVDEEAVKAIDDRIADVDRRLADLGFPQEPIKGGKTTSTADKSST